MYTLIRKELRQYFSGLLGYITIGVFLLATSVYLFLLPNSNILDAGYATLDPFFEFAPFVMLFLIPAITMKSFSDEYRNGTFEVLSVVVTAGTGHHIPPAIKVVDNLPLRWW